MAWRRWLRPGAARWAAHLALLGTAAGMLALAGAPGARAAVHLNPHGRFLGIVRHAPALLPAGAEIAPVATGPLLYNGGPVLQSSRLRLVYWGTPGSFTSTYHALLDRFAVDVAADSGRAANVWSVATQYGDQHGAVRYDVAVSPSVDDPAAFPASGCAVAGYPVCLNDDQVRAELERLLTARGLPRGGDNVYLLLLPPGVASCQDATSAQCSTNTYCGYHSSHQSSSGDVLYGVVPYAAVPGCDPSPGHPNGDGADATINIAAHEHLEIITDPYGTAWFDADGDEMADKCPFQFGDPLGASAFSEFNQFINGDNYLIQEMWSNAAGGCVQRLGNSTPAASFYAAAQPDGAIRFDGSSSTDPEGRIAFYQWSFGDGSGGAGASTTHRYQDPGSYTVTLTVIDDLGGRATAVHAIPVGTRRAQASAPRQSAARRRHRRRRRHHHHHRHHHAARRASAR